MDVKSYIESIARQAKNASFSLAMLSTEEKNAALVKMAQALESDKDYIIAENKKDMEAADENGLSKAMKDRLLLNEKRVYAMAESIREIAAFNDPVGEVISGWRNKDDLWIQKVRVPIGVIGIIYESRPNVTSDCIALALKSSNAVILKGGKEAINSNRAIYKVLSDSISDLGIPEGAVNFIDTTDRDAVKALLKQRDLVDLIIPRGGEGLIKFVTENSLVPVIKHYKGVCHEYVDKSADVDMAVEICFNAKVQRPGVCNAIEKIIVHRDIAKEFLPKLEKRLSSAGVEIRGDEFSCGIINCNEAGEDDWYKEYLDLIVAIKVVDSLQDAINWINLHGSHHSDGIITRDYASAQAFLRAVDSSSVYVNASTRFTDGGVFGLGAEVGISTDKLHARGPMGVEELTTYKYMVFGNGQVRR